MQPERRRLRITFPATGESVMAEMLDDEAPNVCNLVWGLLPVEARAIHGMYSGAEVFAMVDNPQPAPAENLVQLPLPGEICTFTTRASGRSAQKNRWARLWWSMGGA
jgi:hypothetical protein